MDFKVFIVGICLLANLSAGPGKLVIVPNVENGRTFTHYAKGSAADLVVEFIPPHQAYVKFRDTDYLGNENWGEPVFVTDKEHQRWGYYILDGVELSVDHDAEPFAPTANYLDSKKTIYLTKACPTFGTLNPDYMTKKDKALKSAELLLTEGRLDHKRHVGGDMLYSVLTMKTTGNVKLRAKPYDGGAERVLTLQPGAEIYLGNEFAGKLEGKMMNGPDTHSMVYYTMAQNPSLQCREIPKPEHFVDTPSVAAAHKSGGSKKRPKAKPADCQCGAPHMNYGVGCSDSNYP